MEAQKTSLARLAQLSHDVGRLHDLMIVAWWLSASCIAPSDNPNAHMMEFGDTGAPADNLAQPIRQVR